LERNDGEMFQILYASPVNQNWRIFGRIKGAPEGRFQKVLWEAATERKSINWGIVGFISMFLAAGLFGAITTSREKEKELSNAQLIFAIIAFIILVLYFVNYYLEQDLPWI